jgi:PAS domain S-box-containing protein
MLVYLRHAWAWAAAGAGLTTALFAAYVVCRAGRPPAWEPPLVLAVLAAAVTAGTTWLAHRQGQAVLREVTGVLAALRENPSLRRLQTLPPELRPLRGELEALGHCYRQALADLVARNQALQELRRDHLLPEPSPQPAPGRTDGESSRVTSSRRGTANSRSMVARLTPTFQWLALTDTLRDFLGYPLEQLSGRPFVEVVHGDDDAGLVRAFHEALETGEGHNIIFRVRTHDGSERHVQSDVMTRYDDQGSPQHLRCHFLDITERVQTERELRRRTEELSQTNARLQRINQDLERLKQTYRDLYNNSPVMFFSLDPQGCLVTVNETFQQVLGYTFREMRGQPFTRLLAPECRDSFRLGGPSSPLPPEVQTKWLKKDGTVIDVLIRTSLVREADGQVVRSRSAAQDMTEHNRLADALRTKAEELQKANTQLRRINRELDDFTYVVSHDLKEPLRTVEAFSNFLALDYGPQLGAEGQEFISHLIQASRRLGALIDDLLTLSRAGRITHTAQVFDLHDVVQTVRRDLADLLQRKGATVRVEGMLPAVAGDPLRVTQLLANLVGNGLKYNTSPRPEVVIGTTNANLTVPNSDPDLQLDLAATRRPEPTHVTVYVRDNGIGIDPKHHQQIFRIFKRLHRREDYEGTGAGLAICKKITEAHGGKIWVDSRLGHGATFYFTLPRPGTVAGGSWPGAAAVAEETRPELGNGEELEPTTLTRPTLSEL